MNKRTAIKVFMPFLILALVVILAVLKGSVNIGARELFSAENRPILGLRILRVLIAFVAGSGLAASGIVLQAILKNPLAEPYLLGTSSGAGLGAVIAIIAGLSAAYLPVFSFLGAVLSIVIVYSLARQNNKIQQQSLILSGVIVSVALSAIIIFLVSVSANEALHGMVWWLWGNTQVYDYKLTLLVSLIVLSGIAAIYFFAQDLNAISIGEEEAMHLGIDIESAKKILILITSLVTASIVCICGIIGFVGLMMPHIMRMVFGPNHKVLIPTACLAAAAFMIACDLISRTLFPPIEVPIGVITAVVGAPVFIFLLKRSQRIRNA